MAHNGSGKVDAYQASAEHVQADSGTVKVFGRTFGEYKKDFLRKKIGVFFQNYYIFHSPLRENVGVGAVEDMENEAKIREAIKLGGAEKLAANLPQGIDTLLGKFPDPSGTELSGGEKQRVASSRSICQTATSVFDEPASMLDRSRNGSVQIHPGVLDGRTAISISHVGFARRRTNYHLRRAAKLPRNRQP